MLVVAYHFWPTTDIPTGWIRWSLGRGYLWVDLFFVLSGYVMALNYAKLFAGGFSTRVFADFLLRRMARIYPLYIAVLGAQIVYTIAIYGDFRHFGTWAAVAVPDPMRDIPANLLLTQSLGVSPSIVVQAWSISTEFAAYVAFPILVGIVICGGRRGVVTAAVVAGVLLAAVAAIDLHDGAYHSGALDAYDGTRVTPLLRCLGGFLLGMLAFRANSSPTLAAIAEHGKVGVAVLVLLFAMLAAGTPDLAIVAVFPVMILCLSRGNGAAASIFSNPLMYVLGLLSYSVYLLHPLLQRPLAFTDWMLAGHLPTGFAEVLAPLLVVTVLLMLAGACYVFIEQPGRRAIRRVTSGLVPR
jgi:peptidoglycan/LPS O-acetylase OafA/YrhL